MRRILRKVHKIIHSLEVQYLNDTHLSIVFLLFAFFITSPHQIANEGSSLTLSDMGDTSTLSNPDVVKDLLRAAHNCEAKL